MKYTTFPSVTSVQTPIATANNTVSASNIYGSGSLGGNNGIGFSGSGGINNSQGFFLGSNQFATAPASIDLKGNATFAGATIRDSTGTTVIDGTGISSTTQFNYGSMTVVPASTHSNTTDYSQSIPGLTISFTLARTANVYIFANVTGGNDSDIDFTGMQMAYDGNLIGPRIFVHGHWTYITSTSSNSVIYNEPGTLQDTVQLTAGSHILTVQYASTNSTGNAFVGFYPVTIGYIVLGK